MSKPPQKQVTTPRVYRERDDPVKDGLAKGCDPDVCNEDASCVGTRGGGGGRWGASCLSSSCGKRSAFDQDRHEAPSSTAPHPPVPTPASRAFSHPFAKTWVAPLAKGCGSFFCRRKGGWVGVGTRGGGGGRWGGLVLVLVLWKCPETPPRQAAYSGNDEAQGPIRFT